MITFKIFCVIDALFLLENNSSNFSEIPDKRKDNRKDREEENAKDAKTGATI